MRSIRAAAVGAVTMSLALAATACGGGSSSGGGSNDSPKTLTYWASNQGASIAVDKKVLQPELDKFEKQTGIKVKLEVVPWSDLLNRILTATTSGQGPDVLNIGNTWSASLQATGALLPWDAKNFEKIGGKERFVDSALGSTGAQGKDPAAVPLYSMAYALYYNKQIFADAGISKPPATWDELIADGKKIKAKGKAVLGAEGANVSENIHHVFVFAKQHGADFFTADGKPDFTDPKVVDAVKQYVDLMAKDKVIPTGDAEYAQNQSVSDFAKGKQAMLLWQSAAANLKSQGMSEDAYGIAPVPVQSGTPGAGAQTNSMVAGINMAVFKNSHNLDGATKFVKFMTSDAEQKVLNTAYSTV
ncbi:ABC transporter substrate-binding protein, partial [Streptomyces diastatochromogenes]|uniref:ABC transporter substrate-binding protein n=1 Tax=Streptomyces diastatochromogenes TaxID=42236 RepID=UPI00365C6A25